MDEAYADMLNKNLAATESSAVYLDKRQRKFAPQIIAGKMGEDWIPNTLSLFDFQWWRWN